MKAFDAQIETIHKLTKPQSAALKKLGIHTVCDALLHLPYRYLDFSKNSEIKGLKAGENASIKVKIKSIGSRFSFKSRLTLAEALVSDGSADLKVVWFNQGYLAKSLKAGEEIFLAGAPEIYKGALQLTNPIYEKVSDFPVHTSRLVPVYHLKAGIYPKTFRNLVKSCLGLKDGLPDPLPKSVLEANNLPELGPAVSQAHFPENAEQSENAQKRFVFQDIFINQLAAQTTKQALQEKAALKVAFDRDLAKAFLGRLPFELTLDQKKAAWEIIQDMGKDTPMNRLLEGDVGSGKTLVALLAAAQASKTGFQAAFLAPTEILARQHFETAKKLILEPEPLNFNSRCSLLTQGYSQVNSKETPKNKLREEIKSGMPGLYFGTHALLQKSVAFKKLALLVIDEQHRWGVSQRAELIHNSEKVPHLLSLSATPIPRTLKLALFGELAVSQIRQKPKDRKPIITKLVAGADRGKASEFIKKQIESGRQAFVITPLIEDADSSGLKAAKTELENLRKIYPKFNIGLIHGKMSSQNKEAAMADFLANRTQILVATSVVEVGVDIPNASVMLIEGAERFGLSQLHQFRGRVGRSAHQSYCLLFSSQEASPARERLEAFSKTSDGFELAELDLSQRGFGELYGESQSGWDIKYLKPEFLTLIAPARQAALAILKKDPALKKHPALKAMTEDKIIHFE